MLNERNTLLEDDGIEEEILVEEECSVAQAVWGDIQGNIENQTDLQNALDAKQDSLTGAQLNAVNSGITSEKVTTYDGYADQIASKANQSALNAEATTREQADTALGTRIDNEALARQSSDNGLQSQIDAITSKSDVVDVVANYAALQAYDTSTLGNNDVIKVLDDETHEDALTYYRWSTTTQTWSYIGQEAPYYSKGQMDVMLQGKQDTLTAGANIQIENGTISATDTTYTAGNGLNLNGTEFSADTDILATKSDLENYYTKPETDNLLAPKLEAEVVAELPTTGDESKLYLTPKAHTTQTATGNPVTASITEQAGQIESFQLDGDTYQQSYSGKNLFDSNNYQNIRAFIQSDGIIKLNDANRAIYIPCEPNTTYTVSHIALPAGSNKKFGVAYSYVEPQGGTQTYGFIRQDSATSITITTDANAEYLIAWLWVNDYPISYLDYLATVQIEKSPSATDYEPFVGGTPSPNPDYPQPIQTVTGTQTITINGTDYPLDLGDTELCKLGSYQDYIWKDGDDWKVHKATATLILDESSSMEFQSQPNQTSSVVRIPFDLGTIGTERISNRFSANSQTDNRLVSGASSQGGYVLFMRIADSITGATHGDFSTVVPAFRQWLASNNVIVIYRLNNDTDTTITDQTLIAQLEAIRTASLENGANTITNTATGSNLAGDMEIGYYGFNPTNRYDKWLWLDINNEYEQIGS